MARYEHHHVTSARLTGYITRSALENFLKDRFKNADIARFEIQEKTERFEFWAPEPIPEEDMKVLKKN